MSLAALEPEPVPLVRDEVGRFMVPGTRISLDVLVAAFKRGKSPEAVHDAYRTVSLADVYAIFAYYLHHEAEVEAYLAEQERTTAAVEKQLEAEFPTTGLRAKLLARLGE